MNLNQGIPLGRWFGTTVLVHFSHVLMILLIVSNFNDPRIAVIAGIVLFVSVLLHEFGHAFACKAVGGRADLIVMGPMGGLTVTNPPQHPIPQFVTTACGPLVTAILWLSCTYLPEVPAIDDFLNANNSAAIFFTRNFVDIMGRWNGFLLFLNLLPIYPMDGGRLLQQVLWFTAGYQRSLLVAGMVGTVGGVALAVLGLGVWQVHIPIVDFNLGSRDDIFLILIGATGAWQSFVLYKSAQELNSWRKR